MNEESAFLLDILAHPDDEVPRLIYADWLEDHGEDRAELIRLGWELRGRFSAKAQTQRRQLAEQCRQQGWMEYDGLILTDELLLLLLRIRLAETIRFCADRTLPLNTASLEPRSLIGLEGNLTWPRVSTEAWLAMTQQLAIERRRLLHQAGNAPTRPAASLQGGRLVLCDPQRSRVISDFSIRQFSAGCFGHDRLTCWDTWVIAFPNLLEDRVGLISWIPRQYLAHARAGIDTDSSGCVAWLDQVQIPLVRLLRQAGFFSST